VDFLAGMLELLGIGNYEDLDSDEKREYVTADFETLNTINQRKCLTAWKEEKVELVAAM
jgi:hypothetical protein